METKRLDPQELLNPMVFVQVMEEYGIKPKDLGISRNYKYLLKKGERKPSRSLVEKLINLIISKKNKDSGTGPVAQPGRALGWHPEERRNQLDVIRLTASNNRLTPSSYQLDTIRESSLSMGDMISIVERIAYDPTYREYLLKRYRSRDYALWIWNRVKDLVHVLRDPSLLRRFTYRRALGVIETITSLREYARLIYNVELNIDSKYLRKFLPPKKINDITEAILEIELSETGEAENIVDKALGYVERIMKTRSRYRLPVLVEFFTGLRPSEVRYMFENWYSLRKIRLDGVYLVVLNYDRGKKKAYLTLIPEKLKNIIDGNRIIINEYWNDLVNHKYGIRLYDFRKAWIAITSKYLDEAERDLLQGRLRSIQVRHYVKHIKLIAQRYLEAFKPYLYILDMFSQDTGENTVHQE